MKKLLLLFNLLLTSCSSFIIAKAEDAIKKCEFILNQYEEVVIHSDIQNAYNHDSYNNILNYAQGVEELSKPKPFELTFSVSVNFNSKLENYIFTYADNINFINKKTYILNEEKVILTNLKIDTTYYYNVVANYVDCSFASNLAWFTTESTGPRTLDVDGITNVRDIGGYVNLNGEKTRQDMVFRCGQLNDRYCTEITPLITKEGKKVYLDDFKVKSEIDLRVFSNREAGGISSSVLGKSINYYNCVMTWDVTNALQNERDSLLKALKVFTKRENYPIIFHCAIGTDRTGLLAFLINTLLGYNKETIYRDYLYSNFGNIGSSRELSNINSYYTYLSSFEGTTQQEKTFNYMIEIGLSREEVQTIIDILVVK